MSSYKSNKNVPHNKLNYNDQAILVTMNIKHITLISNTINRIKICLHLSKRMPFGIFHNLIPPFQWNTSIFSAR